MLSAIVVECIRLVAQFNWTTSPSLLLFVACLPKQYEGNPLMNAVMDEDVATAEALLTAGADVNTLDFSRKKPLDRATDKACCDLYAHHCSASIAFLIAEPTALVNSAMANCASLSVLSE